MNNGVVLTASAVKVSSFSFGSGTFNLNIQSYTGHTYQFQYTTTLNPNAWTNVGGPSLGTGGILTFTNSPGASVQGAWYRVLVGP